MKHNKRDICLVSSRGGHLFELLQLKRWWSQYTHFWVVVPGLDSDYYLDGEKVYYAYSPEHRNIINALRNLVLGFRILLKERPKILISTGAGIAPPFFLVGKVLGCKLIFIDSLTFYKRPSLSFRLVAPVVNLLLVQHPQNSIFHKKAKFWGSVL